MKKMNKKGFTLAELLIVIAIIAILIAIAIPAFSGALTNAKIQTDNANIRSVYAIYNVAKLMGSTDECPVPDSGTAIYYFQKDGTMLKDGTDKAYVLQANGKADACASSVFCSTNANAHKAGSIIGIKVSNDGTYEMGYNTSANGSGSFTKVLPVAAGGDDGDEG